MKPQRLLTRRVPLVAARLLCWLLLSGIPLLAAAQCPSRYTNFTSQAQVDAFPPGCTNVDGLFIISGPDITNLDGLKNLQSVGDDFQITNNPALTSIAALTALTSVGGRLQISNNPKLASLEGLSKLQNVGLDLQIANDSTLTSIAALTALTSVGNSLRINNNPKLTSLQGLNTLQNVGGDLQIADNSALTSIAALAALTIVRNGVRINNNPTLASLEGLNKLQSVGSDLQIQNNSALSVCAFPAICQLIATKPSSNLKISGNAPGCNSVQAVQDNCSPLAITSQPPSASNVCAGATVTATVSTTGNVRVYQWYQNGGALTSQTSATLTLPSTTTADAGRYVVVVSNSVSSLTSTAFSLTVTPQSPDYQPLVDLYNATNGPGWTRHDNWLTVCTPCGWYGVTCDANGRVIDIILDSNKLSGSLPASLSALTKLQFLNLTDNQLSGSLPASLSALTSLQYLYLGQNQFSGSLPASLSALTNLLSLNLYSNQLSGNLPASLSALTNLKSINLLGNQLNGSLPASLSALTNLNSLILNNNQFSGSIPAGLSALTNLQTLNLQNNQLSGCFPASLSALCGKSVSFTNNPALPGGGDFGAFCASGAGSDAFRPLATASSNPVCADSPLSLSVTAGSAYQWSGPAGFTSTAQSPTLTATTSGLYSVTVGNGSPSCSATASVSVTVNARPSAPSLVTQSGQPYPAGVSSLTISQNVGPVSLTGVGCSGGMLMGNGNAASSFTITTAMTGTQTYTATCTQNGCTSPAGSFQLTVLPTTLSVLHRDADYGNLTNNIIKPYLELANASGPAIPYSEVTVRYWFTSEGQAPPTNLAVYYAQLGAVNMKYVALAQPRQGAYGYVEYSFPGGGSLAGNGNAGPIENGIQKTDGSNLDESDDYSYQANYQDYLPNARITAYRNGTIVWGQEPTAVQSVTAVQAYTQAKDSPTTSQIQTRIELRNTGNVALASQDLRIRYYFTSDNNQLANVYVDYADIGTSNIQARVVKLPAPVGGADSYVELRTVPTSMSLAASSSLGAIDFRLVRSDNGLFDQSNDYSYAPNYGNVGLNNRVTVLLNNRLVFGTPPNGAPARVVASEPSAVLQVRALGNPVLGSQAQVEITGVAGQAISLRLIDLQGRAIHEQRIEQAGETESVGVPMGQSRGTLLLKVSTASQQQSLKLVRP